MLWIRSQDGKWRSTGASKPKHMPDPIMVLELTEFDLYQLLSERSGQKLAQETHWMRTGMETADGLPYGRVRVEVFERVPQTANEAQSVAEA